MATLNIKASARAVLVLEYEEKDEELGCRDVRRLVDPETAEIHEDPIAKMLWLYENGESTLLFSRRAKGEAVGKLIAELRQLQGQALHSIESPTGEVLALAKTQAEAIERVMLTAGVKGARAAATTALTFG